MAKAKAKGTKTKPRAKRQVMTRAAVLRRAREAYARDGIAVGRKIAGLAKLTCGDMTAFEVGIEAGIAIANTPDLVRKAFWRALVQGVTADAVARSRAKPRSKTTTRNGVTRGKF